MMKTSSLPLPSLRLACNLLLAALLGSQALAQVNYTVSPPDTSANVPTSQQVTFDFSSPVDVDATTVSFINISAPFPPLPITITWNPGGTTLTCTPSPSWPAGTTIYWMLSSPDLPDDEMGSFSTAGGSGGGGAGTNAVTSFILQSLHLYQQTNSAAPVLDTNVAFLFGSFVTLASNRTANAVSLNPPAGQPVDLTRDMFNPEEFYSFNDFTNLNDFNTRFPGGSYTFTLTSSTTVDTKTVTLSNPAQQPSSPRVSNYADAQAVNAGQPFTIQWDAFLNGTASDYIHLEISEVDFSTPDPGEPGTLTGTARSFTIPAGTLASNTTYTAHLTFYRATFNTNATEETASVRASQTEFTLTTTGAKPPAGPIRFANPTLLPNGLFSCQITSDPGQSMQILASTTLQNGSWSLLLATNSPSGSITFTDGPIGPGQHRYYKVEAN